MEPPEVEALKTKWNENWVKGLKYLDEICQNVEDDRIRDEALSFVANKIRSASVYRRHLIYQEILEVSVLCRMYISQQFRSIEDALFPRFEIFLVKERIEKNDSYNENDIIYNRIESDFLPIQARQNYFQAYGKNRFFNLGVLSDGGAVEEPRKIQVPRSQKVCMSNVHSLFLTLDGKVYGCGKASLLTIGDEKMKEETSSGYFVEPTLVKLPDDEIAEHILTTETASLILTNRFVYVIGSCEQFVSNDLDTKFVSKNCRRYFVNKENKDERCRFVLSRKAVVLPLGEIESLKRAVDQNIVEKIVFPKRSDSDKRDGYKDYNIDFPALSEYWTNVELMLSGVKYKVFISISHEKLSFSLDRDNIKIQLQDCDIILNGEMIHTDVLKYFATSTGNIMMKLKNESIVRGKLELCREKVDEWKVVNEKSLAGQMANFKVVAIVDDIPGSYAVDSFYCSPDGENCILEYGCVEEAELMPDVQNLIETHLHPMVKTEIIEKFRDIFLSATREEQKSNNTSELLERLIALAKKCIEPDVNRKFLCAVALMFNLVETFQDCEEDPDPVMGLLGFLDGTGSFYEDIEGFREGIQWYLDDFWPTTCDYMEFLIQNNIGALLVDYIERLYDIDFQRNDEKEPHEYKFKMYFQTHDVPKLISVRESVDLFPGDIPIDFEVIYIEPKQLEKFVYRTNRVIFELAFPYWADQVQNGRFELLSESAFNHFFYRANCLAKTCSSEREHYLDGMTRRYLGKTNEGGLLYQLVPKQQITEFVRPDTPEEDIWFLQSSDRMQIPVHRYLLMLHSQQMLAMNRLRSTSYSLQNEPEKVVIESHMTESVIRKSLAALLDLTTLYEQSIEDVINVLIFFDYYICEEAFEETMEIFFLMINDTNIGNVYWLFEQFEEKMIPFLRKHYRLILMSTSQQLPPRSFVKKFSTLATNVLAESKGLEFCVQKRESSDEPKDIIRLMVDVSADAGDEDFWKSLMSDLNEDMKEFEKALKELQALEKTEEVVQRRKRNSLSSKKSPKKGRISNEGSSSSMIDPRNIPSTSAASDVRNRTQSEMQGTATDVYFEENLHEKTISSFSDLTLSPKPPSTTFEEEFPDFLHSVGSPKTPGGTNNKKKLVMIPKKKKMADASELLKPLPKANPWQRNRFISVNEGKEVVERWEESAFQDRPGLANIIKDEKKKQGYNKNRQMNAPSLQHLEMEQRAEAEIREVVTREYDNEALVMVRIVSAPIVDDDEPSWGLMPGILKR